MLFLLSRTRDLRLILIALAMLLLPAALHATHLQGGEVKYAYLGQNPANGLHQYRITFYLYNSCANNSMIPAGKTSIQVNIYNKDTNQRIAGPDVTTQQNVQQSDFWWFQIGPNPIITNPLPPGCSIPSVSALCIRYITYERVVELPMSFSGYFAIYDDFARTNSIVNLQNPGQRGQSIYTDMTSPTRQNSSPVFSDLAVAVICQGDTVQLSNNASDPDGDFLVYSFDLPLDDVLGANNSPTTWTPPASVPYSPGYSFAQPFGAAGYATINASTGSTRYYAPNAGDYVVAILVKEFRSNPDGSQTQIGFTRRELMLFVRSCPPNTAPSFSQTTLNNLTSSVQAGSQTCLFILASDPANQQLTITVPSASIPAGATFTPALPTVGTGQVGNQFCWTPPCSASGTVQIPVKVTDNGCPPKFTEQVFTINITPLPAPTFTGLEAGNYCLGSGPIALTGSPAGGTFSGMGVINNTFDPNLAGVGVHDVVYQYVSPNGCPGTALQTVTVNQGPAVTVAGLDPNYCLSSAPVTLTATPAGGAFTGPGISGNTFNPAQAGTGPKTITYTITAPNGCTSIQQLSTTVFAQPVVTATPNATICAGTATTLQAAGANTYTWTNNQNATVLTGSSVSVTPAASVVYTVTGVVTTGCSATATTTITVNPIPAVATTAAQVAVCTGASTQLTATGAATYNWQPGNLTGNIVTVSPTVNTTYTVTGTTNGCSDTSTVQVTVNPLPVVAASALQSICAGASATLTATGAATYTWQPGNLPGASVSVSPTVNTTYTVTGTDANGCSNTAQATVNVQTVPAAVVTISGPTTFCEGTNVTLTATSGPAPTIFTQNWLLNGTPIPGASGLTFTPTVSGTYAFQITHIGTLCSSTSNAITVTVLPQPVVTLPAIGPFCASDAAVTLAGSPAGGVYSGPGITGSVFTPSAAGAGSHTLTYTFTNAEGCSAVATITAIVNPLPVLAPTAALAICAGASATLTATGAATYTWQPGNLSGPSITVTPAATTIYTVTGTSTSGCVSTATTTVTVNPVPVVVPGAAQTVCAGTQVTLTATGAATYNWQPGNLSGASVTVTPTVTTTYTVTGTSANGCTNTATTQVIANPLPAVATSAAQAICIGFSATLTATGAASYVWQPGGSTGSSLTVSPTSTTTYTVTGTGANGCVNTASTTVTVNQLPAVAISGGLSVCAGSSVALTASGAATYAWSPGTGLSSTTGANVSASPASTMTYTVTGTDANGCVNTATTTLTVTPLPVVTASAAQAVCAGGTVTLTATGATSFSWQPGNLSGSSVSVSPAATTTYTVTGTDANGCTNTAASTVTVNPVPASVSIAGAAAFCGGTFTGLTYSIPAVPGNTYSWSITGGTLVSGTGTSTVVVDLFGNQSAAVSVTETSAAGCQGLPNNLTIVYDTASAEMLVVTVAPDNEQQVLVSWEIPGQVTTNDLFLVRRPSGTGPWAVITTLPGTATSYTDTPGDTDAQSFEYQIRTTNSCTDSLLTVPQRSIMLSGTATEATAEAALTWNSYLGWPNGVREYQLYRRLDTEPDFTLYQTLTDTSATFSSGREAFGQCYRILAISNDPAARESWSNIICLEFENPLLIPNVITPNGDGKNDYFVIDNVGLYRDAELVVMNRWGKEVFRKTNYRNDWSPGPDLPSGTYYYSLTLQNRTVLKGWLSIMR